MCVMGNCVSSVFTDGLFSSALCPGEALEGYPPGEMDMHLVPTSRGPLSSGIHSDGRGQA